MATTETDGRTVTNFCVNFPQSLLMIKPRAIGTITTLIMDKNILTGSTVTVVFNNKQVIAGVKNGASRVLTLVIPTERATSPLERQVITLLDVPPGQVPTSTTPAKSAGSSRNTLPNANASSGITVNWATQPTMMSFGRVKTSLKSSNFKVRPIPNITTISRQLTQEVCTHRQDSGTNNARAAITSTISAMYLPKKSLMFSNTFISFSSSRTFSTSDTCAGQKVQLISYEIKKASVSVKRQRLISSAVPLLLPEKPATRSHIN